MNNKGITCLIIIDNEVKISSVEISFKVKQISTTKGEKKKIISSAQKHKKYNNINLISSLQPERYTIRQLRTLFQHYSLTKYLESFPTSS